MVASSAAGHDRPLRLPPSTLYDWIAKAEAGAFDDEVEAASLLAEDDARIVTLERLAMR